MIKGTLLVAGFAAWLAFVTYGVVAETGPIGWLNYAQQSVFGAYSRKFSFLVLLSGAFVLLGLGWWIVDAVAERFGTARRLPAPATLLEVTDPPTTTRGLIWSCVVVVPLIWAGGYGVYAWAQNEDRADRTARYEPVDLAETAAAPQDKTHLALRGRLLWERTVVRQKNQGSTPEETFVPVVGPRWKEGDEVTFIARMGPSERSIIERGERRMAGVVLVRTDGAVPVPAAQEFRKMGAPNSDSATLLRVVLSQAGQPEVRDDAESDFRLYLYAAAFCSVFYVLFIGAVILGQALKARREGRR